MTANAKRIMDIIAVSTAHLTAEETYRELISRGEKISLATVYNSLNKLHEEGLIRRIPMEGQPDRYDKTIRHDHILCTRCGKIEDAMLEDLRPYFFEKLGVEVDSYDLKLFYVCEKCREIAAKK